MAAVAYELPNAPEDVKVFYQLKPAPSVQQRKILLHQQSNDPSYLGVKKRFEKDPITQKYVGTPLVIVFRNSKSSKDFNFTIAKDISTEVTISLNDFTTNHDINNALNKSINRLVRTNKVIGWRFLPKIFQSESPKTTKQISIDTFTSSRFESDSESFISRGDESETEIEHDEKSFNELPQNRPNGLCSNLDSGRCSTPNKVSPVIKIPLVTEDEAGFLKIRKPIGSITIDYSYLTLNYRL